MKKIYLAIIILLQTIHVAGQCPTSILHDPGDGTVYYLQLLDGDVECANYSGNITINGVTYELTYCDTEFDEAEFTIVAGGTQVIIANDAPITIVNGATTCTYDASGSPVVLPVELLFFEGEVTENGTVLNWQTASEENNKGFDIQRSADGKNWKNISFVQGNGTTLETQNYAYTDDIPLAGVNYYRLKQMDFDGHFEYSDVVNVTLDIIGNSNVRFFPNPVADELTIQNGKGEVTIYNVLGQPVRTIIINNEQEVVNVSDLAKGQYILSIQQENGTVITKRFVK